MTIVLYDLAERAKNNNWTITNEEAIDIWLIIPEGCHRRMNLNGEEYLLLEGLGEFKIK